jgi:hypothetical protein
VKQVLIVISGLLVMAGCTTMTPKISHVHVGHALTGWVDTPGKKGLFVVAEDEAEAAIQAADRALQNKTNLASIKANMNDVLHAIDPSVQATGKGHGYGLKKALIGAKEHITFAAESDDASPNIKSGARAFAQNITPVIDRCDLVVALAQTVKQSRNRGEAAALTEEIRNVAVRILEGHDEDNNGVIGSSPEEFGLRQLRKSLSDMTAAEQPPYKPVGDKYLFGLVRLPSGKWAFKDPDSAGGRYGRY